MSEKRRRITAKRKQEMVLRLLRGETLDALSREFDIPAEKLTKWRDVFLYSGLEGLKDKPTSPINTENQMLKQMIGEKSMEIELLYQNVEKLEAGLHPKSTSSLRSGRAQSSNGRGSFKNDLGRYRKSLRYSTGLSGVEDTERHLLCAIIESEARKETQFIARSL